MRLRPNCCRIGMHFQLLVYQYGTTMINFLKKPKKKLKTLLASDQDKMEMAVSTHRRKRGPTAEK